MSLKKAILPATPLTGLSPPRESVWRGPEDDGITQTMVGRYLTCPDRFRILYVEGLQAAPSFRPQLEFGNLWHAAEEAWAKRSTKSQVDWQRLVFDCGNKMGEQYPMQRDQVIHWIRCTIALFPVYMNYWKKHPDMLNRKPLLEEEAFSVEYKLPSGRRVRLRGKWDSVDLVTDTTQKQKGVSETGIWLQENKTKSQIDKQKIERMLRYDLQTMLYLIALSEQQPTLTMNRKLKDNSLWDNPIKGVRYNVIRRSTHKTDESMIKKCTEDVVAGRADEWFCRWNSEVSASELRRFRTQTLDPILENICDDYEWWALCKKMDERDGVKPRLFDYTLRARMHPEHKHRHFVMPYIGYNPLAEGGETDVDRYLFDGNEIGLRRITHDDLFPELKV